MRQRSAPNRGVDDYALSGYYRNLARGFSALGRTREAVGAAAAGVVVWGRAHSHRSSAIHGLEQVIVKAKDLDEFVKFTDEQTASTGLDSPLIRQCLGSAFALRNEHEKAVVQFRAAIFLQSNDLATHQKLIASYKALKDHDAVVRQTLTLLELDSHNLEVFKSLESLLRSDETLAERAATTIVEVAPLEAGHHEALAIIRQQQDRWSDAIGHWKHVARLRSLEPNGLLMLATAQIHAKRFDKAQQSIDNLNGKEWPSRFHSVRSQIRNLQHQIPQAN
jgi:tetratricopeptide (TPR) repeat protein